MGKPSENSLKIGIIGGAGYTAGELIRILIHHPEAELTFVQSSSQAGKLLSDVHEGILGETNLTFQENPDLDNIDILFLCTPHGESRKFWEERNRPENLKVIDLSQDYRDESDGYVYGLPEINYERIKTADSIANPGCFATAIQLSLIPLATASLLPKNGEINITAVTGSTGAGVKPGATTHFSWRNDNLSVYKPFTHQHLKEITATLKKLQKDYSSELNFIPVRGDFPRGIFSICTLDSPLSEENVVELYKSFYRDSPFTIVSESPVDLKQAVNTNKAIIHVEKHGRKIMVICAEDNLLKGASGQAVQNMNIMAGLDQTTGLKLKASAF